MITALAFMAQVARRLPMGEKFSRRSYFLLATKNCFRYIFGRSGGEAENQED
jgi:hypothetical protein